MNLKTLEAKAASRGGCERILQEHLLEGHIVEEFAIAHNPLYPREEASEA